MRLLQKSTVSYNSEDGRANVTLYARDGSVWMNQSQLAELFDTSKQSISYHINNILSERELSAYSVVKEYLTTATDDKQYKVSFYSLEMILDSLGLWHSYREKSIFALVETEVS